MRRGITIFAALALTHCAFATLIDRAPAYAPDAFGGYASTHVIIRVAPGVAPVHRADGTITLRAATPHAPAIASDAIADVLRSYHAFAIVRAVSPANTDRARRHRLDRYYRVRVPRDTNTPALVRSLNQFAAIETAELDGIGGTLQTIPSDPDFPIQYGLNNTGQDVNGTSGTPNADINAPEAWNIHTGTDNIIIAVIDTGISLSHPDLAGKVVDGRNFNGGPVDDYDDSRFFSHGTHCAGIATALGDNAMGIAGVSWGAKLLSVKTLDTLGIGTESATAEGVVWAADRGAHIASMSLGFLEGNQLLEDAMNYAHAQGMLLVSAAGNIPTDPIYAPAKYDVVIAVGATDNNDQLADFTTTGPEMDLAAPGVDVWSCTDSIFLGDIDSYDFESGTSMACPHVAGAAALIWSYEPTLTNTQLRALIEQHAHDLGDPGWDPQFGHGRLDVFASLRAIAIINCPGDIVTDGAVNSADLSVLLANWDCPAPENSCRYADLTGDGLVDANDLNAILGVWGPCE